MTENEAIKVINDKYETFFALSTTNDFDMAMATAIQALEEIQQYRAIGTVEECAELLEYRAIGSVDRIKGSIEANYVLLHTYESIGTIEEFKALKEKETEILLKDGQLLYQQGLVDGYAKAIDEFAEKICQNGSIADFMKEYITEIAKQMKAGVENDNK